jgi:hypothetical protein
MAKWVTLLGMGIDEDRSLVQNEMARPLAWIRARGAYCVLLDRMSDTACIANYESLHPRSVYYRQWKRTYRRDMTVSGGNHE